MHGVAFRYRDAFLAIGLLRGDARIV